MDFLRSPYFRRDYVKKYSNRTFYSIFQVLDVLRVDDKKFSLSLSLYFGVVWKEHRLHLPPPGSNNSGASWLPIDLEFMSNLWVRILIFSKFSCMFLNPNNFLLHYKCWLIFIGMKQNKIFFWKKNQNGRLKKKTEIFITPILKFFWR